MEDYEIYVEWSDEDSAFIARCDDFPYCAAHGDTEDDARLELEHVIETIVYEMQKELE